MASTKHLVRTAFMHIETVTGIKPHAVSLSTSDVIVPFKKSRLFFVGTLERE